MIIALFLSMAVLSIGDSLQRDMRAEIERLQSILIAVSDDAVYSGIEHGIYLTNNGYMVLQYNKLSETWVRPTKKLYLPYQIPESMRIEWTIEGFNVPGSDDDIIDAESFFGETNNDKEDRESVRLSVDGDSEDNALETSDYSPQIYALSSGELTVFEITFKPATGIASNVAYELRSDGFSMPMVRNLDNASDEFSGNTDNDYEVMY